MQISKIQASFSGRSFRSGCHGKRCEEEEPTAYSALDEDWRKYVVPAGEPNQGKIFYQYENERENMGCANCEKGNALLST